MSVDATPSTSQYPDSSNPELCRAIAQRILNAPQQRITFADFMDMALYHPEHGYYASRRQRIGARGDFVTSPHMGADFGELLAEQFAEMWTILGKPRPFHLVEMGAGQGLIVRDVLQYLYRAHFECFEALEYLIIEKSSSLIAEQQQHMSSLAKLQAHLRWCHWEDIDDNSITGCFFSNELVDAFPVHQLIFQNGIWHEVYVTVVQNNSSNELDASPATPQFVEVIGELSSDRLRDYFSFIELDMTGDRYPDGYRTEVNLAALDWMKGVSSRLNRGYVLTIDYGYSADRYYSPSRTEGTLQCYYQHAHHSNPYRFVGQQDITAHVDFTALERQGEQCGLAFLNRTQQGLFLMALGLGDRIASLSYPNPSQSIPINDLLRRRESLHALINPMGLGNFQVLLQSKALQKTELKHTLKGFNIPAMMHN